MKFVTIAATLLAGAMAFAYPSVKDQSTLVGVYTDASGARTDFTQTLLITAFDEPKLMYTVKVTAVTSKGQTETQEQQVSEDDLMNGDLVKYLLENCAAQGGKLDKVTVPAGTFDTCALPTQDGTTWVGDVIFGIVKVENKASDGSTMSLQLQSFVDGLTAP